MREFTIELNGYAATIKAGRDWGMLTRMDNELPSGSEQESSDYRAFKKLLKQRKSEIYAGIWGANA